MTDNLNAEPIDDSILAALVTEISAGRRHRDFIPEDLRAAAAGVLRAGPALARVTSEIQRTVNPHRKFPPITQWIMDQIEATETRTTTGCCAGTNHPSTTNTSPAFRTREQIAHAVRDAAAKVNRPGREPVCTTPGG
jgi:hypothetical protein